MKTILAIATLLINCNLVFPQETVLYGEVRNRENKETLPYVNIGIAHKTVGTVSGNNGKFRLIINDKISSNDTVLFSFIGFKTVEFPVSELKNRKDAILLQPVNIELDEVEVTSGKIKLKSKTIGRTTGGLGLLHANFYASYEKDVDDRLSKEMGMKFSAKRNCNIRDLNFNITGNDFKSLKFRVNFYRIREGLPDSLLVEKNIIFEVKDNFTGWFKVDLEPYKIYIRENVEEFAVTLQWLESVKSNENSKYFSISTAGSPVHIAYFREKAMDTWNKSGQSLSFYLNSMCE